MNGHRGIYRITWQEVAEERAARDRAAALTINALREPLPDTFLGRQHYEIIPLPHEQKSAAAVRPNHHGDLRPVRARVAAAQPDGTRAV
jgi:hypothetical protein